MPLNRRYPIAAVLDAAREYAAAQGPAGHLRVRVHRRRQRPAATRPTRLAGRLTGFRGGAHVNLIPLNPTAGYPGRPRDRARIAAFAERLRAAGVDGDGAPQPRHRHRRGVRPAAIENLILGARGATPGCDPTQWRRERHPLVNPHQPQTLYVAVILCYVEAFFNLLSLGYLGPLGFLILVGLAGGGFGIANEKKWGYALAVAAAVFQVVLFIGYGGLSALGYVQVLIAFAFDVLLVVLLLHPMSRQYQRIWFK